MNYLDRLDQPDQPPFWPVEHPHLAFVVKLHQASSLHFDFRLELDGRLVSWVIREHPSLNPHRELWAIPVDDHSLTGLLAEWRAPDGVYGAGPMLVWDRGYYTPLYYVEGSHEKAIRQALHAGRLDLRLHGHKLRGKWRVERKGNLWSLRKLPDEFASLQKIVWDDTSVITGKSLSEI